MTTALRFIPCFVFSFFLMCSSQVVCSDEKKDDSSMKKVVKDMSIAKDGLPNATMGGRCYGLDFGANGAAEASYALHYKKPEVEEGGETEGCN